MRDITNKLEPDELHKRMESAFGHTTLRVGETEITVPGEVVSALQQSVRLYEVDDISDIIENYGRLSETRPFPEEWVLFRVNALMPQLMQDRAFAEYCRNAQSDQLLVALEGDVGCCMYSVVSIHNVYLANFASHKGKVVHAFEFDVVDRYHQSMRGIFAYKQVPEIEVGFNDWAEKKVQMVVASPSAATFDLHFLVLNEHYVIQRGPEPVPRGRQLLVHSIDRMQGEPEETPIGVAGDEEHVHRKAPSPLPHFGRLPTQN